MYQIKNLFSVIAISIYIFLTTVSEAAEQIATRGKSVTFKGGTHSSAVKSRLAELDLSSFKIEARDKGKAKKLKFQLFEDLELDVNLTLKDVRSEIRATWQGHVEGKKSEVLVSRFKEAVVIDIFLDHRQIQVRPTGKGDYIIEESDVRKFPSDPHDGIAGDLNGELTTHSGSVSSTQSAGSVVDILVMFTKEAGISVGGLSAAYAFADNSAAVFNQSTNNSLVGTQLRVVHVMISDSSDSGNHSTDLTRLRGNGDGFFDEIHAARNFYGADLIHLITESGDACGRGYVPGDSAVSARSCAIGNKTFAHEVGHNFGCGHDKENASSTLYSYSYGYRFVGSNGATYRTIMAYAPGTRISYFSNPNVLYYDTATGVKDVADNARTIINYAPTLANYRAEVTPPEGSFLVFSSNQLNFGSVAIGEEKSLTLDITNQGANPITITGITNVSGNFLITNPQNCLLVLNSFSSCRLLVSFKSDVPGSISDQIILTSPEAQNSPASVNLLGTAVVPTPIISVSSSLSFSKTAIGSISQSSLRITNMGTASLSLLQISLTLNPSGVFSIVSYNCSSSLAPSSSCDVQLSFKPIESLTYSGTLTLSSNDPIRPTVNVSLSGSSGATKGGAKGGGGGGGKPAK